MVVYTDIHLHQEHEHTTKTDTWLRFYYVIPDCPPRFLSMFLFTQTVKSGTETEIVLGLTQIWLKPYLVSECIFSGYQSKHQKLALVPIYQGTRSRAAEQTTRKYH